MARELLQRGFGLPDKPATQTPPPPQGTAGHTRVGKTTDPAVAALRFETREKRLLFPALLLAILGGALPGFAMLAARLSSLAPGPLAWLAFSLPFAAAAIRHEHEHEYRRRRPRLRRFFFMLLLALLWSGLAALFFPGQDLAFNTVPPDALRALGALLLAVFSYRFAAGNARRLLLLHLVPQKKRELGKDFSSWGHDYLQGVSVTKTSAAVKRRCLLLAAFAVLAATVSMLSGETPLLLQAAPPLALIAALLLSSNLTKYELYAHWVTEGIEAGLGFFRQWLLVSLGLLTLLTTLALLVPKSGEILPWETIRSRTEAFFRQLSDIAPPDRDALNEAERERVQREDTEEIEQSSGRLLDRLERREETLRRVIRIALLVLAACFILALAGGIVKRACRYRRIPRFFAVPVVLWEILARFLSIFAFILRVFFFIKPYRRKSGGDADGERRQNLERLLAGGRSVSPEKRAEITTIVELFLRYADLAAERGLALKPGETPSEFTGRIVRAVPAAATDAGRLTGLFYRCRYSDELLGENELADARRALAGCERHLPPPAAG